MKAALSAFALALLVARVSGAGAPSPGFELAGSVQASAAPAAWAHDQLHVAEAWSAVTPARTGPVVAVLCNRDRGRRCRGRVVGFSDGHLPAVVAGVAAVVVLGVVFHGSSFERRLRLLQAASLPGKPGEVSC